MKIHELAHLSGVNPETIRMYRQKGLLHPARLANGYFDYSACNLYELMFVRKLRGANLGLETIASFYAEDGQAGALRNMKQEIRALEEAIRELEQRKKQLMSTLGHYVLFSNQPQQVQELTLRSECWFVPLELEPADSVCRRWMEHADALFTGIRIAPAYLEQPTQQVPYTMELGAYTEDLKRLKLPLPPQARRHLPEQLSGSGDRRHPQGRSAAAGDRLCSGPPLPVLPGTGSLPLLPEWWGGGTAAGVLLSGPGGTGKWIKQKRRPQGMLSAGGAGCSMGRNCGQNLLNEFTLQGGDTVAAFAINEKFPLELQVRQRPKTLIFGQRAFFAGIKRNKAFLQKIGSKFSIGIAQNAVNRQAFCLQAFQQTGL